MTENPVLHILRICVALVAAPWALAIAAFIIVACSVAQALGLLASAFVFLFTFRWAPCCNMMKDVGIPRIQEMWRDWSALWRSGKAEEAHAA